MTEPASPSPRRISVEGSLYRVLRRAHSEIRPILASKATMVATSHLIEDLVARSTERNLLMSGFQHGRHWAAERDRYLEMAGGSEVIAVFAGRQPPPDWLVDHVAVRLNDDDPLTQEWFVLALGPEIAVTLCGLDALGGLLVPRLASGGMTDEADRLFEVIWSFDPTVARTAAEVVLEGVRRSAPERADEIDRAVEDLRAGPPTAAGVAQSADHILAGLLDRLERLRGRERRSERRANEAKTEFLSRMSHELRTPLNAILGFTQLLELDDDRSAQDHESLRHILQAGRHLLSLVDEVLDITRIETGKIALSLEAVDVGEVVEESLALVRPLAEQRAITVDLGTRGQPAVFAHADRQRLSQILLNLLSNAIKYNVEGGELEVRTTREGDLMRVAVRDTGPGIAADDLRRLFVPFERLPSTAAASEGTGLGLALCQRMAQAMDGRIEVSSRPGAGSTFTAVLPAADPPAEGNRDLADDGISPAGRQRDRVLYIEDNLSNVRLVERILQTHADIDLLTTVRGDHGVELAREHRPALILLDLNLPDLPGREVLAALRGHPETADTPVVVVSSDAAPGSARELMDAGASAFIVKPLEVAHLLETIVGLLRAPGP